MSLVSLFYSYFLTILHSSQQTAKVVIGQILGILQMHHSIKSLFVWVEAGEGSTLICGSKIMKL